MSNDAADELTEMERGYAKNSNYSLEQLAENKRELSRRASEEAAAARSGENIVAIRKLRAQEEQLAQLRSGAKPRRTELTGAELSHCAKNGIDYGSYLAALNGEIQ